MKSSRSINSLKELKGLISNIAFMESTLVLKLVLSSLIWGTLLLPKGFAPFLYNNIS
jgi:hypothetical protein